MKFQTGVEKYALGLSQKSWKTAILKTKLEIKETLQ